MSVSVQEREKKGAEPNKIRTESSEGGPQTIRGEGETSVMIVAKGAKGMRSTKAGIRDIVDIKSEIKRSL